MLTFANLGRYGRFANGLFQIAGTIGIAIQHGYAYGFPEWINHDHKDRFGSSEDCDLQKYFVNPLPRIDNASSYPDRPVHWGWHPNLSIPDNTSLSGHFQSEKYFTHCIDIIRHFFRMVDEPEPLPHCAVHVRLGDYDDHYHPRLKENYYMKAVLEMEPGTEFIVFSDDRVKALEMFARIGDVTGQSFAISTGSDYIQDFKTMKRCRHFITGNSSYSLMAAILGDQPGKKIICPRTWFGPAWGGQEENMAKDVYPEGAVVL